MSSKRLEEKNEKVIRGLMKLPPNRRCINCNSLGPQYVCTNFWTFVCTICSGIHREFTHRVKSVSMSKFTTQEVESLQNGGNQRAREIYLKDWELHRQRHPNSSDVDKVREFIKAVYISRKYAGGNNSEKSPGDAQIQGNVGDETRRASSYHSFSQSPPYDFQYEDRMNRKKMSSLTRKTGSDHNIFERKAASFIYSPGRLSEHLYEDRFANDGSSSRVSDYSFSSGGDPFKSAPQSPNLQKDDGYSSPTSDSSREIADGLHRQTSSEICAKRDIDKAPLPRPQRTVSSGSVGSFEKNSVPLQSTDSGILFDVKSKPNQSNTPALTKVSTVPSSSVPVGGLNLFEDVSAMPAINSTQGADLFQAPRAGSVASVDLFQSSADSSAKAQKFPQTSSPSSSSFFSQISQNPRVPNSDQKLSEPSEPSNEGWATFDSPQPSPPCTTTFESGVSRAGYSVKNLNSATPSNIGLQWLEFPSSDVHSAPQLVSNPWNEGLQNVHGPTDMPSSQEWKAFEEADEQQHQCIDMGGKNLQVSADKNASSTDLFFSLKTPQDSVTGGIHQIASTEGFSFPTLPPHTASGSSFFEPIHPFMNNIANVQVQQKPGNPFDIPFDSESETHNVFLDMSTLQAALPSAPLPSSFMGGIDEPWFPGNPAASPGGMPYMMTQAPNSQLQDVPTHGSVASVGGNPFV